MNIGLTREDFEKRRDGGARGNVGRVTDMLPCTALILNYHRGRGFEPLFFSVSLARAHVHVRRGSREGPAGEYMLIYADREGSRYTLSRKRCIKRASRARCFLPAVIRVLQERVLFHFMRWPPAKNGPR